MTSSVSGLFLVLGLWLTLALLCCAGGKPKESKPLTASQRAEAQTIRESACKTVDQLRAVDAFTKIEPGYSGVTHAYVGREFLATPVDAKETAMKAVALCFIDIDKKDQPGLVIIHNGYSGKRIGTFDFMNGLEME